MRCATILGWLVAMVAWIKGPQLKNVGFLDVQKAVKYKDFVIYVLAQVKWLWCQTTIELAPSVGGRFMEKLRKIPMCTLI